MKKILFIILLSFAAKIAFCQNLYFPPNTGNTWDTLSPTSLGWCQDKIDSLLNYLDEKNTKAFILLKNGKIVIEKYYGTFTQDSLWYWASAGKTLTGFTVGIAQQEGLLSINDTTSQYLGNGWTSCPTSKEEMITIKHQLSMTSGLDDGVPDNHCTIDTCLQYLADAGTRWAYHNAPYTLLDGVIAAATGQSLNAYITQKIKIPTGMTGAFYPSGYDNVFVSKPRSMARFGLLMLNKGNWNGNQIMTDSNYFHQMTHSSQNLNHSYGYLCWLNGQSSYMVPGLQLVIPGAMNPNAPDDMIAAMGKNGQFINIVPSQKLVYIRMGNAPDGNEVPFLMNDTLWQKLNLVMCNTNAISQSSDLQENTRAFPNPFSNTIQLQNTTGNAYFTLMNMYGEILFEGKNIENEDFSHLRGGIYCLKITDKQHIQSLKVIKK